MRCLLVAFARFVLPISFLLAIVVAPRLMLREWKSWPRVWVAIWDDPL
jgi:hypothetical protein